MWTTPLQVASLIGPCEMQGKEWIEPLAEPDRDLAAAMTARQAGTRGHRDRTRRGRRVRRGHWQRRGGRPGADPRDLCVPPDPRWGDLVDRVHAGQRSGWQVCSREYLRTSTLTPLADPDRTPIACPTSTPTTPIASASSSSSDTRAPPAAPLGSTPRPDRQAGRRTPFSSRLGPSALAVTDG